jgi:hypothetical protein
VLLAEPASHRELFLCARRAAVRAHSKTRTLSLESSPRSQSLLCHDAFLFTDDLPSFNTASPRAATPLLVARESAGLTQGAVCDEYIMAAQLFFFARASASAVVLWCFLCGCVNGAQGFASLTEHEGVLLPSVTERMGTHIVLEVHGAPFDRLNSTQIVAGALRSAVAAGGLTVVGELVHQFPVQGVSAILMIRRVLAEAHPLCPSIAIPRITPTTCFRILPSLQ